MNTFRYLIGISWRSIVVGIGYIAALLAVGIISGLLGVQMSSSPGSESILIWVLISGVVMALLLGPLAARMQVSRWRHIVVWTSVIFFNMGSVAIEGAIFAPELVSVPLSVLFGQQLAASVTVAVLILFLFSSPSKTISFLEMIRLRPWYAWGWRFVLSSLSYLLFYYVFGAVNYALVTGPYYTTHAGGLTVPPTGVILAVESIRAPLIVLSVALFVLSFQASKRRIMVITGLMLFWIGGIAPLLLQVSTLPLILLAASVVEIFFQNFLTGMVTAGLLWTPFSQVPTSIGPVHSPRPVKNLAI